jgi:sugar phosphate isomerase/epimerase
MIQARFSTGTFGTEFSLSDRIKFLVDKGVNSVELSGGNYEPDWRAVVSRFPGVEFSFHNYFPAPSVPFVMNLASSDSKVRAASVDLCKNGIRLASEFGLSQFSFHAGFCFDPTPESLGAELESTSSLQDRKSAQGHFYNSLDEIIAYGQQSKIRPLVENNVINLATALKWGKDSLLLTNGEEIELMTRRYGEELGYLVDIGHLIVSSKTLGRDFQSDLTESISMASALHLHSNNGLEDQHLGLAGDEAWWPTVQQRIDIPWTFEVKPNEVEQTLDKLGLL